MSDNVLCRFLLALSVFSAAGCTVKEQREDCPCRLVLDFSETDISQMDKIRVNLDNGDLIVCEKYSEAEDFFPEYVISAPREELELMVCSDDKGWFDTAKGIVIPEGQDCPRLYMYSNRVDARSEMFRETVRMHKNHCVMNIYMEGNSSYRYDLCVKGNVNGYGKDGRPRKGDFSYTPSRDEDSGYVVSLPRQSDSSLLLEIDDGTEVLKTFALGEYIKSGGYDWTAPDLEDLTVHVNWAVTTVSITVSAWDWVYECEIII
jgi:hypothetical protein